MNYSKFVKDLNGNDVNWSSAVNLMDDDIYAELHMELAPCDEQIFFSEYEKRHQEKFGEDFIVN